LGRKLLEGGIVLIEDKIAENITWYDVIANAMTDTIEID